MLSHADNDNHHSTEASVRESSSKRDALRRLADTVARIENSAPSPLVGARERDDQQVHSATAKKAISLLSKGWMHEFWAQTPDNYAAAMAFLLEGLKDTDQMILWVISARLASEHGLPYGPGLLAHGIDPARIILVYAQTDKDVLWAMDEGLKAEGLAAVVGETGGMPLQASRRLSLTAKEQQTCCLHLVRAASPLPSATYSRWQVSATVSAGHLSDMPGFSRISIRPVKHRGGLPPKTYNLEWQDETHHFHLASPLADRPLDQSQAVRNIG